MKISLLLVAAVFLLAVASAKKVGKEHKEKADVRSEKHNHNKKKYSDNHSHHDSKKYSEHHSHHDSKKKSHSYENLNKNKVHDTESLKKTKEISEITKQDHASQKGTKTAKKTSSDYQTQVDHEDLHLQDLSHPSDPSNFRQDQSPNDHHKGHKMSHQSASHGEKRHNSEEQENMKLFADPKEKEPSKSHAVLENSFETINDEAAKEDVQEVQSTKKHTKKNSKKDSFETIDNVAIEEETQEVQPRKKHTSKEKSSKKAHEKSEKYKSHKNPNKANGKKGKNTHKSY